MPFFTNNDPTPQVRLSARISRADNINPVVVSYGKPKQPEHREFWHRKTGVYGMLFPENSSRNSSITPDLIVEYQNLKTEIEQSQDDERA